MFQDPQDETVENKHKKGVRIISQSYPASWSWRTFLTNKTTAPHR